MVCKCNFSLGQTAALHSSKADELFECVRPFCGLVLKGLIQCSICLPPENIRKLLVFLCF